MIPNTLFHFIASNFNIPIRSEWQCCSAVEQTAENVTVILSSVQTSAKRLTTYIADLICGRSGASQDMSLNKSYFGPISIGNDKKGTHC